MGNRGKTSPTGFTDSELAEYNKNEPPLTVYFSDDDRLMPLRLETSFWLGMLSATLAKECRTGESCLLGESGEHVENAGKRTDRRAAHRR